MLGCPKRSTVGEPTDVVIAEANWQALHKGAPWYERATLPNGIQVKSSYSALPDGVKACDGLWGEQSKVSLGSLGLPRSPINDV